MSEALRLAELIERDYHDETLAPRMAATELRRLVAENKLLNAELAEQARLNGMGGEREARLMTLNTELVEALHHISLCSQNSMSSQRQCGEIARAALAKVEASK